MIDRSSTQIAERIKLSPRPAPGVPSSAGSTAAATTGPSRSGSRSAVRERACDGGVWPPRGGPTGRHPEAGEHASRPGILLAGALASHPRAASRDSIGKPAPPGRAPDRRWVRSSRTSCSSELFRPQDVRVVFRRRLPDMPYVRLSVRSHMNAGQDFMSSGAR